MFQTLNGKGNRFWTTAAGLVVVTSWVAVLAVIPLIYYPDLPMSYVRFPIVAPPSRTLSAPAIAPDAGRIRVISARFNPDALIEPRSVPARIVTVSDEQPLPPGLYIVDPRAVPGGMPDSVPPFGVPEIAPPPPPPPPAQPSQAETPEAPEQRVRIWIGGNVQAAKLISQPRMPYPPLARQMRVQGAVRLEAIINMDGTVEDLRVLSGHPLLVQAALDSVSQWRYEPTLLNGQPVEVMTVIEINFTLAR
jgi:protein TonB